MGRLRTAAALAALLLAACTAGGPDSPAPDPAPATTAAPGAGRGPAWRRLAPVPSQRTEVAAAAVGSRIWVLGGYGSDGTTLATAEAFDTGAGTWSRGPDLPVAVNHAMAATLDGVLYVAGGNDDQGPSTQLARLDGNGWRTLAALPQGRSAGGLVALDGRLYLVGGVVDGGLAADTQVYDPDADRWSSAPGLPTPREHLGAAAAGGRVYVVGGRVRGVGNSLAAAEVFDPGAGRWSAVADLPTARGGLAATATAGGLVVRRSTRPAAAGGRCRRCPPRATASGWWPSARSSTCSPAAPGPACTPPRRTRLSTSAASQTPLVLVVRHA